MALEVAGRPIRPITADEAMAMVAAGILGDEERVELLDGVLTQMSPQHEPHAMATVRLTRWLAPLMVAGTHDVRVQAPFAVPDRTSLPEPDLAVVPVDDGLHGHRVDALLVIEVAVSSLRTDLGRKAELYASAGVPEYWVLDVPARRVVRHTQPSADGFASREVLTTDDPSPVPGGLALAPLDLVTLLAGLTGGPAG